MMKKEKIKEGLITTLLLIVLAVTAFFLPKFFKDTSTYVDQNIRTHELEEFMRKFEKETEQFREKNFVESQLGQDREAKNPLPVELRRERFVVFTETMRLQKKYLTDQEYSAFCLLYRDMQERKLEMGEVKLMMYFILKVTDNATPEEMKVFEEGNELDKKIEDYYAQLETRTNETPAQGKK